MPDSPDSSAEASLRRVIDALGAVAATTPVWPRGLLHPGGPHWRLAGHKFPISIGEDECLAFGRLIEALRPRHAYVIGNAFGLSSAYIADMMRKHGGESCTTLDDQSEGDGQTMASVASALVERLGLQALLRNRKGSSPQDIAATAEQTHYDLVFIDGLHRHPQVTEDLLGMLPYVGPETVIALHDSWIAGVPEAAAEAKRRGFRCLWLPTSCEIILATRDHALFVRLRTLFPGGIEDQPRRSYLYGHLVYAREVVSFHVNELMRRA